MAARRLVPVRSLPQLVEAGPVALVGGHGGMSVVTGEVRESGLVFGTLSIEVEHGVLYLDADGEVEVEMGD